MTMSRNERGLSRRAFLGLGATAAMAAGAAGLAGCSPQASSDAASAGASDAGAASGSTAAGGPSFLTEPSPIAESDIKETVEADIVIVGAGLSGISAARAAVESGAKNIVVVEKATTWQYRSNQVGCIGGKIQEDLGIHIDKNAAVGQIMKECGYRPNQRILNLWADNSGEAFDWFLAASEGQYVVEAESDTYDGKSMSVRKMHWPHPAEANIADDFYPIFDDCQICLPDNGPYIQNMVDICEKAGVQFLYSTFARQLVRPDNAGRVEGVIVEDENGDYKKITARKAVLSCGDMSSDTEMLTYYAPQATKYGCFFSTMDKSGKPVNTGDGHKMAMWAGAVMEDGPYAPMTHSLGTNSVGIDPFLMVNQDGKRFANEDVGAQELQNAIKRQKGGVSYQIFDSKWKEQLSAMPQCFGGVTHYIPPEQEAEYEHAINHFAAGYAPDTYFQGEIEQGSIIPADSIEELAKAVNIPADALVETVERYNELAHAGKDADFSKVSSRLFPIENPPYYAVPFGDSGMLVLIGGIDCDVDCRALDAEKNPVPGLFVAGNTMGGRFLVDYPVTVAGASHSMAMSFGRLAGRKAAEGK